MRNRLYTGLIVGIIIGFVGSLAVRSSADSIAPDMTPVVVVPWSETPGWIDIHRDGELRSEWRAEDGDIYTWLEDTLSHDN